MLSSLQFVLAGLAFGSAGGFTPGPTITLVISQTLRHGVREGFKIAISPLITDAPIILLAIFVLRSIDVEPVLGAIALAGAAFLFYLAYESFTAKPPTADLADVEPASIRKGIIANALNPHPWVFWLSIGGPTTLRAAEVGTLAVVLFLVSHYACLVGAKVLVAVLVERGRSRLGRRYGLAMKFLAAVLVLFAVLFLREGLQSVGLVVRAATPLDLPAEAEMTASRKLAALAAVALGLAGGWAYASDPNTVAADPPAFRAPEEPSDARFEQPAEPTGTLSLDDALTLALMGNPELQAVSWQARAGEARVLQAGKIPNPELDVRVYQLVRPEAPDESRTRVRVSQEIELGGKRRRRIDLASSERGLADWDYETQRVDVVTLVTERFVEVLGAQRDVDSRKRKFGYFDAAKKRVAGLVDAGVLGSLQGHLIQRRLGLARIDMQRAESDLAVARFALVSTWGGTSPQFTLAVGDLKQIKIIPDIETVMNLAQSSPSIARWNAELARGEAALALARSERIPDVTVGVGTRREQDAAGTDYLVDVEIDIPIFDRNQGEIRAARHELARVQAQRKAAEAAASEAIAAVYYALTESRARSATMKNEVLPASRAAFDAYRLVFEKNGTNLDDVLDARRDLARAEVDLTDALVDYRRRLAELEGLVGNDLAIGH